MRSWKAEERGLLEPLEQFTEERSLVADALTYWDLTTRARRLADHASEASL